MKGISRRALPVCTVSKDQSHENCVKTFHKKKKDRVPIKSNYWIENRRAHKKLYQHYVAHYSLEMNMIEVPC